MDVHKLVAWNLRRLRVSQRLSQEALAADAEVDRAYVGRLERSLENPTIALLDRLAQALGAHMSELFAKQKPGASPPKPLKGGRKRTGSKPASR
jgi:transcriptional regulator with XRE-family HTH domain